ncbi:MAG: PIN domain-containing protein [Anaerolineae bacterium]|nr:PIN domain-containing protein [Anaerolineae bacterium]
MRVYLDTCSIQRPLDSRSHVRIALEGDAVLALLALCESGLVELVSSDALVFETERNPLMVRREHALAVLAKAALFVKLTDPIEQRAQDLTNEGFKPLDALNIASAEAAQADYFCTCDDRLLRRARSLANWQIRIVSPLELIQESESWS